MTQGNNWVHFYYDGQSPAMVNLNGTLYTYVKSLQGDIVAILNISGSIVVEYKYDAWGRPLSTTGSMAGTLGALNPFRYRGYVYDQECELYFLITRYYSPNILRFINIDSVICRVGSYSATSMFCYCANDPIVCIDRNGDIPNINLPHFVKSVGDNVNMSAYISRYNKINNIVQDINARASRKIISRSEMQKAVKNPLPASVMNDTSRHLENIFTHNPKILFGYTTSNNQYIVYAESKNGSIIRWTYEYKEYVPDKDSQPLYRAMDWLNESIPADYEPFIVPSDQFNLLSIVLAIYDAVSGTPLPPDLHVTPCDVYVAPEDIEYYDWMKGGWAW